MQLEFLGGPHPPYMMNVFEEELKCLTDWARTTSDGFSPF